MTKRLMLTCTFIAVIFCMQRTLAVEGITGGIADIRNSETAGVVTLHIENGTNGTYSYGWVNSCFLNVKTEEDEFSVGIGSPGTYIFPGENEYKVQTPVIKGKVVSAEIIGLCPLDSRGLPVVNGMVREEFDLTLSLDKIDGEVFTARYATKGTSQRNDQLPIIGGINSESKNFNNRNQDSGNSFGFNNEYMPENFSETLETIPVFGAKRGMSIFMGIWLALIIGLVAAAEVFIYKDTGKRGMSRWWMITPLGNGIGFVIYLVYRNKYPIRNTSEEEEQREITNSADKAGTGGEDMMYDQAQQADDQLRQNIEQTNREFNGQVRQNAQIADQQIDEHMQRDQAAQQQLNEQMNQEAYKASTPFEHGGYDMTQGNSFNDPDFNNSNGF